MDHYTNNSDDIPPLERREIITMIVISIFIPVIGPAVSLLYSLISIRQKHASTTAGIAVAILIIEILAFLYMPGDNGSNMPRAMEAETMANTRSVGILLQTYANDHNGLYPESIQAMIKDNPTSPLPMNPFTQKRMRDVSFGSPEATGELTYVPIINDGKVVDFYVMSYGRQKTPGEDVNGDGIPDHVLIVVSSRESFLNSPKETASVSRVLPDLKELLNAQSDNPQPQSIASPENLK
jgi:hypothetical protein